MFAAIAMFFRSIQGLLKVVDINVSTLQTLSQVGNDMADAFGKEQKLLNQKRLEAIERGEDPDADD